MSSTIEIVAINDIIPLRHEILRLGKPIETCYFEGDDLDNTKHFAYIESKKIIGVTSLYLITNSKIKDLHKNHVQYQMRGMAISKEYQNKGIGKKLLQHVEQFLISLNNEKTILWFNARESALPFYEKLDYKIKGDIFEIPEVGSHFMMYKILT